MHEFAANLLSKKFTVTRAMVAELVRDFAGSGAITPEIREDHVTRLQFCTTSSKPMRVRSSSTKFAVARPLFAFGYHECSAAPKRSFFAQCRVRGVPGLLMLHQIQQEIKNDLFYQQNFANEGERFIAWYLRRVLLRDPIATRDDITDGQHDKQIDAVIVDDEESRIVIIQGKFIGEKQVDAEPLREVLSAWMRLQDLQSLQKDCNEKLKQKLEAVRKALDDEYRIEFELITTGNLTDAARADLSVFTTKLEDSDDFAASLHLIDTDILATRLAEAEAQELPSLDHTVSIDPGKTLVTQVANAQTIITVLPLRECLKMPGITDGRLFRKNVRQSLGANNKVNRALRATINGERVRDFFFYHNGITAICDSAKVNLDKKTLSIKGLSVVNGCQSLSTIYSTSERVRAEESKDGCILFRFYEIPERALADRISINTNSQSAVKPRDLRSNDKTMVGLKRAFETRYPDGFFLTKRGEERPADKDARKTIDAAVFARMIIAWHSQRPNLSVNEKRLFDEHYKTIFRTGYDPGSILALQTWLNAIEEAWPNLALNDVLKAGKSYVKYHILFAVSAIIASTNKQPTMVIEPSFTMKAAENPTDILPLAANCVENALQNALNQAQVSGKVFSPQNWLKSTASVQGETLVAGTIAGMLPGFPNGKTLLELIKAPVNAFSQRWSAE
ncbi:MAG: AIPR family protein [Acidobacteriaceae bacterium]|nr:AIPR family protein [Acidobacteriaceae bacterium]